MPLHEYQCRACGSQFEELVRSGEDACPACPACPACGGTDVIKLISAASLCGIESGGEGFPSSMGGPSGGCGGGGGGFS